MDQSRDHYASPCLPSLDGCSWSCRWLRATAHTLSRSLSFYSDPTITAGATVSSSRWLCSARAAAAAGARSPTTAGGRAPPPPSLRPPATCHWPPRSATMMQWSGGMIPGHPAPPLIGNVAVTIIHTHIMCSQSADFPGADAQTGSP